MNYNGEWSDYKIIACGGGEKLEMWKDIILLRPDPQAIWPPSFDFTGYKGLHARYIRSESGGGRWEKYLPMPEQWVVSWRNLKFIVKPTGFKHTGLFPEQALNWDKVINLIKGADRNINVLNLFAYTGGATLACASAGAEVCHVDAAKAMVERAGENARLSGLGGIRYIIDDCFKFVQREIKRGKKYDAVIMDPPSYGRGPSGEVWKMENGLYPLVESCAKLLSDNPLFFLINSYTTGLQPTAIRNILVAALKSYGGRCDCYEVCLPTMEEGILLPCGASALYKF
jgi:23S rRNA (cytosine1962-C5)-methyltransferase